MNASALGSCRSFASSSYGGSHEDRFWRGNRFFTAMHVVFSVTWIYMTAVFGAALWRAAG
jgi:hypothetical protein